MNARILQVSPPTPPTDISARPTPLSEFVLQYGEEGNAVPQYSREISPTFSA